MTKNLYEILELSNKASKAKIKAAYRRLSKENHPDKGGDQDVQANLNLAYEVLMDDEKRARYDVSGDFGREIEEENKIRNCIAEAVSAALGQSCEFGLLQTVKDICLKREKELEIQLAGLKAEEKKLRGKLGEVTRGDGEINIFQSLLEQRIESCLKAIESCKEMLEFFKKVRDELKRYKSERDFGIKVKGRSEWYDFNVGFGPTGGIDYKKFKGLKEGKK